MRISILMKTSAVIVTLVISTILFSDFSSQAYSNSTGAPTGKTGSPGDGSNCTGCHSGTATAAAGLITSDIPASGYVPGTTYTITGSITSADINKFGFEISPQKSTGTLKGTMVITNATETKLIGSGKYITHTAAGTTGTGSHTWSFDWIAPTAGSGDVTFYGAFIAANGNSMNTGDQVFLSNLPVHEHITTGIEEINVAATSWTVYPNPATDKLYYKSLNEDEIIRSISIIDITGKLIKLINNETFSKDEGIDISYLHSGMYVLNIVSDKGTAVKRFVKN